MCVTFKQRSIHLQGMHTAYIPVEEQFGEVKGVKGS